MEFTTEIKKKRLKGIGGSEVPSILGLSEFGSPYGVWLAKTGRSDVQVDNKYTRAGNILESAVAEYFEQETNCRIIKASAGNKTFRHPKYDFAIGTPDRTYISTQKTGKGVLECKTTQRSFDDVPEGWFCQLQWYLGILGLMYGGVAWLEHGVDFKYKEYEYDHEFFEYMVEAVQTFWTENVLKDIPPDPINSADVEKMFSKHREGKVLEADSTIISVHGELIQVKGAIKDLEARESELTESLKMVMRDAEAIMLGTKPLVTWKSSKDFQKFDEIKFKLANPEIWSQCQITVSGSRRFLVKN